MMLCRISHGDLVTVARDNIFVVLRPLPNTSVMDKDMGVHLWHALGSERGIHKAIAYLAQNGLEVMPEFVMLKVNPRGLDVVVRGGFTVLLLNHDGKYATVGSDDVATWREHTGLAASEFCVRAEPGKSIQGEDEFYLASGVSSISVLCSLGWDDPDQPVNAVELVETGAIPEVELYADADAHSLSQAVAQRMREARRAAEAATPSHASFSVPASPSSPTSPASPTSQPVPLPPQPTADLPVYPGSPDFPAPAAAPTAPAAPAAPAAPVAHALPVVPDLPDERVVQANLSTSINRVLQPLPPVPTGEFDLHETSGYSLSEAPTEFIPAYGDYQLGGTAPYQQYADDESSTVLTNDVVEYRAAMESQPDLPLPAEPIEVSLPAPAPAIRLSNGVRVSLDRPVLIGRAPEASRFPMRDLPRLISVPSPTNDVSRTHAQVRVEGEVVLVTDLNSTNGVLLIEPGATPRRLHPDEPMQLKPQVVVDLGDGVTFELEAGS